MPPGAGHGWVHCRQLPPRQDVPLQLGRQGAAEPAEGSLQSLQCNQGAAQCIWNQVWADTRHVEVQNRWNRAVVPACQVSWLALVSNLTHFGLSQTRPGILFDMTVLNVANLLSWPVRHSCHAGAAMYRHLQSWQRSCPDDLHHATWLYVRTHSTCIAWLHYHMLDHTSRTSVLSRNNQWAGLGLDFRSRASSRVVYEEVILFNSLN